MLVPFVVPYISKWLVFPDRARRGFGGEVIQNVKSVNEYNDSLVALSESGITYSRYLWPVNHSLHGMDYDVVTETN